jgi:hypothetical protein
MAEAKDEQASIDVFQTIQKDIERFSGLHSWYKHISLKKPSAFYMICARGLQPGNDLHEKLDDGLLHWYFFQDEGFLDRFKDQRVVELIKRHTVTLNPFIWGDRRVYKDRIHHILTGHDYFETWLTEHGYNNVLEELKVYKTKHPEEANGYHEQPFANYLKINVRDVEFAKQALELKKTCKAIYNLLVIELGYTHKQIMQPFKCWYSLVDGEK